MLRDLRLAIRMLLHAKAWTAVIVVSLALGIGGNAVLFSAVNGLLLRTVPASHPETLVKLGYSGRNQMSTDTSEYGFGGLDKSGDRIRSSFSYPMYQQFRAENDTMTDLIACAPMGRVNVVVDGNADIASSFIASGNYFQMLGVSAVLGRTFGPDDDKTGAPPVAVLGHTFWRTRFSGDRGVVGRHVVVNNVPVTVIGVLPASFTGIQQAVSEEADVSVPLTLDTQLNGEERLSKPTYWWLQVVGRLKPGATKEQVLGNLSGMFQGTARAGMDSFLASLSPAERGRSVNQNLNDVPRLTVGSASRGIYEVTDADLRAVTILTGVVTLVLLIVCANVANMLLSRATARQKEISVRLSLGATRARLVRQLLTESVVLALVGGAFGILVAYWGRTLLPGTPGRAALLDWRVLSFFAAVTMVTGILFGTVPALSPTGVNTSTALKESSRSVVGTRSLLGRSLVVFQVAISLVLLVGAGLFLRTLQNLRHVDVGFDPQNVLLFRVNPSLNQYEPARAAALLEQMLDRLPNVGGARAVGFSQPPLLSGSVNSTGMFVRGRSYAIGETTSINRMVVSPSFFDTMHIRVLAGRGFTARDTATSPFVAVVNETAARQFFADPVPLGRRFGQNLEDSGKLEVVGIVRDVRYNSLREPAPPTMYVPYTQARLISTVFAIRTAGDPVAAIGRIREAVRQIDPNLPMMDVATQVEKIEGRFQQERVFAQAYALFGGLALLLAAVGLFGLMSYSVSRRTGEIGIRMALGAQRGDVLKLVMSESMLLVGIGLASGLAVALAAGRLVASLLFDLQPTDALALAGAILTMMVVAGIAGYLPARRASLVDPMVALHYE